jgi:hypothetical protein
MLTPILRAENPKLAAAEFRDQILHIKKVGKQIIKNFRDRIASEVF